MRPSPPIYTTPLLPGKEFNSQRSAKRAARKVIVRARKMVQKQVMAAIAAEKLKKEKVAIEAHADLTPTDEDYLSPVLPAFVAVAQ